MALKLGVSEEFLYDVSIKREPEDGCIAVYGTGDDYTSAFTTDGIDRVRELIAELAQADLPLDPA